MRTIELRHSSRIFLAISVWLSGAWQLAAGEPVVLPAGTTVPLVLQHHVNSSYSPVGSIAYFRVSNDILIDDQVLISKGTLVAGAVRQSTERGMVGKAGMLTVEVDELPGVDGTKVPVDAYFSKQGRSRSAATVGWTVFWGLPGLITKGVNPHMIRGDELQAVVTSATSIDPTVALPPSGALELGPEYTVIEHHWKNGRANGEKRIDIERSNIMGNVSFKIGPPAGHRDIPVVLSSLRLFQVDGIPVPEEMPALSVSKDSAEFNAWSIARFCSHGVTNFKLVGTTADGQPFHATHEMKVEIKKKH